LVFQNEILVFTDICSHRMHTYQFFCRCIFIWK